MGQPYLFENLEHDVIDYPHDLGQYMSWLWTKAEEESLNEEEIQASLDKFGEWISMVEASAPIWTDRKYK